MIRFHLDVTLLVKGPVISRSSSIGDPGVDSPMAKRKVGDTERYYLPGRLVKGLLREAWQELGTLKHEYAGYVRNWLGEASSTADDAPERGRLYFSDFLDISTDGDKSVPTKALRYRIHIDETTGAADSGMLQAMDAPYGPMKEVSFSGEVRCLAGAGEDVGPVMEAVQRGLLWVRAVGGARTSGFGEVVDVKSTSAEQKLGGRAEAPALRGTNWEFRISFSEPVILSKRRIADNLFESGDVVPGGALKGAVADMISREPGAYRELLAELHSVGFTHGFPALKGQSRPCQRRLSLLSTEKNGIVDALGESEGLDGRFKIDWKQKDREEADKRYPWPRVPFELRVRTEIDSSKRKSRDEALFAWQMLNPEGFEWVGRVETSALTAVARAQLRELLAFGLEPIGKTKALGRVELADVKEQAGGSACPTYTITLQSEALLIDPAKPLNGEADLRAEFDRVWKELSDDSLSLVNYFQSCSLAGGEYFRKRFSKDHVKYKPYLLSETGSTFRLQAVAGKEGEAEVWIRKWMRNGLPLSSSVRRFYRIPEDLKWMWKHCPYLPENGYGEIHVGEFDV